MEQNIQYNVQNSTKINEQEHKEQQQIKSMVETRE